MGILNRINLKAYPSNSDTACILKNEELKKNNTIKALKFKAIEKDLYTEELKNKKDKSIQNWAEIASLKISKLSNNHGQNWFRAVGFTLGFGFLFFSLSQAILTNTLMPMSFFIYMLSICGIYLKLFLNCLIPLFRSNKKYITFFNCFIKIIFFIIFNILMSNFIDINVFFISYFSYLNPTNFDLLKNMSLNIYCYPNTIANIISIVFYFLGKISVGYGIFEIIQAFRKLNAKV